MPQLKEHFWLNYSWKNRSGRLTKKKPSPALGEIAFQIELAINVPHIDVPTIAIQYDVPPAHVEAIHASEQIEASLLDANGNPIDDDS